MTSLPPCCCIATAAVAAKDQQAAADAGDSQQLEMAQQLHQAMKQALDKLPTLRSVAASICMLRSLVGVAVMQCLGWLGGLCCMYCCRQ
jgi:hypothetical protein